MNKNAEYLNIVVLAAIVSNNTTKKNIQKFVDYVERIIMTDEELNMILQKLQKNKLIYIEKDQIFLKNKINKKISTISGAIKIAEILLLKQNENKKRRLK